MSTHPQTIQIFLPSGDAQGIRIAGITTRIVRVIDVPRSLLGDFLKMPEAAQVGVYFLLGEDEESAQPKVYIGQTGSLGERIADHHKKKDFWNRALIAVSLTQNLTGTHSLFLEWMSIQAAHSAARYQMENGTTGSRPHTTAPLEAECNELHETIRVLLTTLGYPIFESVAKLAAQEESERLFYCKASEADAQGILTEEGFVVLKGSSGRRETVPTFKKHGYNRVREQLVDRGVIIESGDRVRFEKDHLFASPSAAAACVTGRTANGLIEWRDSNGKTLRDIRDAMD